MGMKKNTLTATEALSFRTTEQRTALNVKMGTTYEVNGGWYSALANYVHGATGAKITVRAHGPRMGELYGLTGDLNSLGLHVKAQGEVTARKRKEILKAIEFFLGNVTVQRTVYTHAKTRMELRAVSKAHGYGKTVEGKDVTIYGITHFVVAF